jgi:hypothetical protein
MKDVPIEWDKSKFVTGHPAKHVFIARGKGSVWYIACVSSEQVEKEIVCWP